MDKKYWREKLQPYIQKSTSTALTQILTTLVPIAATWYAYKQTLHISPWLVIPYTLILSLFTLRSFVLLHDCGHGALFESPKANKFFGYVFGVVTGMPQYVWSKHHNFHHTTNGNWEKYHGPLNVRSTEEYSKMSKKQQRRYWMFRHPAILIVGGFYYVLFNPRFTWMMGSLQLIFNIIKSFNPFSDEKPLEVLKECESKYWKTPKEFRHMTYNNITLLSLWVLMSSYVGTANFFIPYTLGLSISGALGILFFTMQHNFEHSYASDTARVSYFRAALEGTSYLKLPRWLDWFTADIAYHHIHHLSTAVPNYHLRRCHNDLKELFTGVRRISLKEIPRSFSYQLWDEKKEILISKNEFHGI